MEITFKQFKQRLTKLAFHPLEKFGDAGRELIGLAKNKTHHQHHRRLGHLIRWMMIPFTLWVIDIAGLSRFIARKLHTGEKIDPRYFVLIDMLAEMPSEEEQQSVIPHEWDVQNGQYAHLLLNPAKYDAMEAELLLNPKLTRHWNLIKSHFDVTKFQRRGVIRRTQNQERNFRPEPWFREKATDEETWLFYAFFDNFCRHYILYGMELDRPLLQRFTINRSALGTHVFVPRYMNMDWWHDINMAAYHAIHWNPDLTRQGPKASLSALELKQVLRCMLDADEQAKKENITGAARWALLEDAGRLQRGTDRGSIRRRLRAARKMVEKGKL